MCTGTAMQPIKKLTTVLESLTDEEHYLFTLSDLHGAMPEQSASGFKALVCRAEKDGLLKRVCRGVYLYRTANLAQGLLLYHAAAWIGWRGDYSNRGCTQCIYCKRTKNAVFVGAKKDSYDVKAGTGLAE